MGTNLKICFFMLCWEQKRCFKHFLYVKIKVEKTSLACSLRMEYMSSFQRSEPQNDLSLFFTQKKFSVPGRLLAWVVITSAALTWPRKWQLCMSNNIHLEITAEKNTASCAKKWSRIKHHVLRSTCIISQVWGLFWELPVSVGQPQASKCFLHLHPVRALLW